MAVDTSVIAGASVDQSTRDPVPLLQSGDRLTRREFERRYARMPHTKKAELIEGVVYLASPLSADHGRPHSSIMTWLGMYKIATPGADLLDNTSTRLDSDNEVQPDAMLRLDENVGGQTRIIDGFVEGPPELVVEIAVSSAAIDLGDKKRAYRRAGVCEYVVWLIYEQRIDWFVLSDGEYVSLSPDASGLLRSQFFPGLWLNADAALKDDFATVLSALQQGLSSAEHTALIERLKDRSKQVRL